MVTIREFAKQVGRSHELIRKLVNRGIVPLNDVGKIPLAEGLEAFRVYDEGPKQKAGRPRKGEVRIKPEKVVRPPRTATPKPEEKPVNVEDARNVHAAMNKAKLADTTYKARIRELEFKLKSGELLPKSEVIAEAQWLAEQVKAKLMAIPPRISSMCEGRPAREIEEIITDSLNSALKEFQKCKYQPEQE